MKAPKQKKALYQKGSRVRFSSWWYGRPHKHDGHRCTVVKSWVKVAGRTPRNYYKYRLLCGRCKTEFNAEDNSGNCQSVKLIGAR